MTVADSRSTWRKLRPIMVASLLLLAAAVSLAVAIIPSLKSDRPGIAVLLLLVSAMVIGGKNLWRRPRFGLIMVVAAAVAMIPFTVIARAFGRVDMMALLFHVEFGAEGATLVGLESEILAAVLSMICFVLSVYLLDNLLWLGRLLPIAAALVLIVFNPMAQYSAMALGRAEVQSDFADRMATPRLVSDVAERPDVIVIYLEGMELRYEDRAIFGDAFAPLAELAPEALMFRNVGQTAGTGWSLAGMVASQCGVPLVPNGFRFRNNYTEQKEFLKAQVCLGDVLAGLGYRSEYVVGGDVDFAGINHFYATHNVPVHYGLDAQIAMYPPEKIEAASIDWILDDELIFETARGRYDALAGSPEPFALFVETIGPHGIPGYLSRRCTEDGRGAKSDDLARVVRCTAEDARDFVRYVQERRGDRPTRIVLMSDHLSHHIGDPVWAEKSPRRNTVMFLGGAGAGQVNEKPGSMIDVYPTLLDWLGLAHAPVKAGLGVSLLSEVPTVVEELGLDEVDRILTFDPRLSNAIWR